MTDTAAAAETVDAAPPEDIDLGGRSYRLEIFAISFASLLLEIAYTRLISFKLFYYYTYLVIGLALLGIGCGAVLVAISGRLRRAATDTILTWGLLLGALSIGAGYLVIATLPIATFKIWDYANASTSIANAWRLLVVCLILFASFLAIGVMIATLFGRGAAKIGRLYFADLLGAGVACAIVVALLARAGATSTIFVAAVILAACGARLAWVTGRRPGAAIGAVLAVLLAVGVFAAGVLPEIRLDAIKHELAGNPTFSEWSPIFRVDALKLPDRYLLFHDGLPGSAIYPYNGDPSTLSRFDTDLRALPFSVHPKPPGDVMIVGAAGGHEVLTSLYFDAGRIDAVELNPVTYSWVKKKLAAYSGHLADNPKVHYVRADGRSYIARTDRDYDLIWFPAPDSYAASSAATASAFVLSESYLYTSEAIVRSLHHLRDGGVLAAQFGEVDFKTKPNRTARYVGTARHALAKLGIDDPRSHIIVSTSPTNFGAADVSTILVKRQPFTAAEVAGYKARLAKIPGARMQYAPGEPTPGTPVSDLVTTPSAELGRFYDGYRYNIRPVLDDSPFFWHFRTFGQTLKRYGATLERADLEVGIGERVLVLLLGIAVLLAGVFLILPFLAIRRTWRALPAKGTSALYFAALGFGFMFFEITLIQRLTLFLGYPTYSLTVTLASLLLFTGVGALLSERRKGSVARTIPYVAAAIAALTLFYLFVLPSITDGALGWPLAARVALAFVFLAPLGLCLGMFMPLGLGTVAGMSAYPREYVAWGWAVNGFASVIGSVLTTILAMTYGFRTVLVLALVVYAIALGALHLLTRTAARLSFSTH